MSELRKQLQNSKFQVDNQWVGSYIWCFDKGKNYFTKISVSGHFINAELNILIEKIGIGNWKFIYTSHKYW